MEKSPFIVVTGLSGSGKSVAIRAFEDLDYRCLENLPLRLLEPFEKIVIQDYQSSEEKRPYALLIDCRAEESVTRLLQVIQSIENNGVVVKVIFLDARNEVIVRRYQESRRPHPLIHQVVNNAQSVLEAVDLERNMLSELRNRADLVIDSSETSVHTLRKELQTWINKKGKLTITVQSFGFKFGLPSNADMVLDVRFLANPHFVPELKDKT